MSRNVLERSQMQQMIFIPPPPPPPPLPPQKNASLTLCSVCR